MAFSLNEQEQLSLRAGDILVCEGGEVGRLAFLTGDLPGIYFQNALHRIRVNHPDVLPGFVTLALEHLVRSGGLEGLVTQVTIAHLNQHKLRYLPLSIPPLAEQRRIVDVVGALDDTIKMAAEEYVSFSHLRNAICASAQNSGTVHELGSLASVSQGKSLPKAVQGSRTGEVSWFKIADMTKPPNLHGYIAAETAMSASELVALGGRIVEAGSIVFPRVGAAVLTEKKRLMLVDGALDENHLVLTPKDGVPSELLLAVMENLSLGGLVQSGAVPSLNMGLIRATRVAWPRSEEQVSLAKALGQLRHATASQATCMAHLSALRTNLLADLLSGEHEIPESYDELMQRVA